MGGCIAAIPMVIYVHSHSIDTQTPHTVHCALCACTSTSTNPRTRRSKSWLPAGSHAHISFRIDMVYMYHGRGRGNLRASLSVQGDQGETENSAILAYIIYEYIYIASYTQALSGYRRQDGGCRKLNMIRNYFFLDASYKISGTCNQRPGWRCRGAWGRGSSAFMCHYTNFMKNLIENRKSAKAK